MISGAEQCLHGGYNLVILDTNILDNIYFLNSNSSSPSPWLFWQQISNYLSPSPCFWFIGLISVSGEVHKLHKGNSQ